MPNITIDNVDTSFQEAFAHHQQGEIELAKRIYEAILLVEPNHFNSLHMLGVAITDENPSVAVAMISKAIDIDPTFVECFNNAANALIKMEQYSLAIDCCNQAISLKGDYWEAYANRGEALRNLQRWTEALISYDLAIDFKKDEARLYSNRGNVYGELGRLEEGLADLNQSISLDPQNPEAFLNRGNIHQELGRLELAKQDYTKAIELAPNLADAHFNLALLLLLEGNLEEGWAKYDWRWKRKKLDSDPLISEKPKWQKGDKHDRVLVWAEQGVGDHVFFGSLLPEMKQLVPNLLVQIDERLIPLFQRSMPEIAFYPSNQPLDESQYDAHLPMGDLAAIFRSKKEDFANRKDAFLIADKERARKIRQSLCKDDEVLIGISWKSKNKQSGLKRSYKLVRLASQLISPGVKLVNLQYGDVKEELEQLKREHGIEILQCANVDNTNDLDGLAALIEACDKVESVDNTTVHIAGAIAKKTSVHLLLKKNWRWVKYSDKHCWYQKIEFPNDYLENLSLHLL
ncbi:tetratricopeptide repeat protein [Polynucleobacter paneuropaeus]|nr:tetratricopeptide repeat protein [Polynucleobacter paneuropaeus]